MGLNAIVNLIPKGPQFIAKGLYIKFPLFLNRHVLFTMVPFKPLRGELGTVVNLKERVLLRWALK